MGHQSRTNFGRKTQFLVRETADEECIHTVVASGPIATDDEFLLTL
jgi:hypothetical protein